MTLARSPWASIAPYPAWPVSEVLARAARQWPNHIALVDADTGSRHTFAETYDVASRLARVLQEEGVAPGDRVALTAPNSAEWVVAYHATLLAGAVVTPLNPLYREREVASQLADATPTALISAPASRAIATAVWGDRPRHHPIEDVWSLAAAAPGPHRVVSCDPFHDLSVLPYSSGTTGVPKGVMLTHFNLVANIRQYLATGLADRYSTSVDILPFFHIYGMTIIMNGGLAAGATQVIVPRFTPERFLGLVEEHQATVLFVAPPIVSALLHAPPGAERALASVTAMVSGAAPLPPDVARGFEERYGLVVTQGYGMTEASPMTNATLPKRDKPGTVGPPVTDTIEKVVDPVTRQPVGVDQTGELWVKGPQVMKGYWNQPAATEEALVRDGQGDDELDLPAGGPWLRTGDIVTMDSEGYVTIVDRAKEMIKYKGYQVAPAELEALLVEHPAIIDAAVVPAPDDDGNEVPKAFVVLDDGATLTADAVRAFVADRVAPHKKLRDVQMIDEIPRNPAGKILRRALLEQATPST
jgi:acyl-CoA synthetase (AMP-forming)/AMP-acid ligase II